MKVALIVAYGKDRQIGLNNQLLWHIPEDLKQFKELTDGQTIIMGRNTFESLPKVLPNRHHIVITSRPLDAHDDVETANSLEDALEKSNENEKVWIIGGAKIYNEAIKKDLIDEMHLSEVTYYGKADAFINDIDFSDWDLFKEVVHNKTENNPSWVYRVWCKNKK